MKTLYKLTLMMMVAGLILAGCGKKDDAGGTSTGSSTTGSAEEKKPEKDNGDENKGGETTSGNKITLSNCSFSLPEKWDGLDTSASDFRSKLDEWKKDETKKGPAAGIESMAANADIKYAAFDLGNPDKSFGDNLNVIIKELPSEIPLEAFRSELKKTYESMSNYKLIGEPAIKNYNGRDYVETVLESETGGSKLKQWSVATGAGKTLVTFTFTCQNEHGDEFQKAVESVMNSAEVH